MDRRGNEEDGKEEKEEEEEARRRIWRERREGQTNEKWCDCYSVADMIRTLLATTEEMKEKEE